MSDPERIDESPVQENPVDENPVDESPVDETPVEETPVTEGPAPDGPPVEPVDDREPPEPSVEEATGDEALERAADDVMDLAEGEAPAGAPLGPAGRIGDLEVEEVPPRLGQDQLKAIVEALIFASPEPLTPRTLFKLLSDEPKEDVMAAVQAVQDDYANRPGLHVAEVAGGFQITTRPELNDWVRRLFHERTTQKLSVAALETLSVVAYKQPITQAEIGEIRGVNTSGVLSTLLERHLIKIVGRKNVVGRPFLYGTTKEFLIRFGLKDLGDLPKIEDMAQQLGFEPPTVLMERSVPDEMLPLEEGDPGQDATADDESREPRE
jgi:segregation and condensation protein B